MRILRPHHHHLGNLWSFLSTCLAMSARDKAPVYVSRHYFAVDVWQTMAEILQVMHCPGAGVFMLDEPANDTIPDDWNYPIIPTRMRWWPRPLTKVVCYQLNGRTHPHKTDPPPDDLSKLLGLWLPDGWSLMPLGLPLTIEEDVFRLANAACFLGVDSGISHIAYSVGCPVFLLEYQEPLEGAHKQKPFIRCRGADDAILKIRRSLGLELPP